MIITRTPYRISLIGGGTDFPEFFNENGGSVIGFALAHYSHLMVRKLPPYFEYRTRAVWSKIEHVNNNRDIEHPAIREVLKYEGYADERLVIHHDGDLPARSGMGSSSSFVVGLLHALNAMSGFARPNPAELAKSAIYLEREHMHEAGGWQDQIFAAHGGFLQIDFNTNSYKEHSIYMGPKRIEQFLSHLLVVFTSMQRNALQIEHKKIENIRNNRDHLLEILSMVPQVRQALVADTLDMKFIGQTLHRSWELKQALAKGVTDDHLNGLYEQALRHGAWGGKLLGAGGGGFFLFVVPPERRAGLKEALGDPIEIPVKIDYHGSRVMVFEPNGR